MTNGKTFRDMFVGAHAKEEPVTIIFDEADNLAGQTADTIANFLQELRGLQERQSSLRGLALLGTHELIKIIQHRTWSPNHIHAPFDAVRGNIAQLTCLLPTCQLDVTATFKSVSSRVPIAFPL